MTPPENKKSIYYITIDRIVTTRESFLIKHSNRVAAEKLAEKGQVEPFYEAQFSNHRKLKFTAEIPEDVFTGQAIDGETLDD